jgi:hypothetical protein|tara:strand:+ start:30074 stop:32062 length:1989 start_codon:yes stop_codon:yes gene_type:complete
MALNIQTFTNMTGGLPFFKAVGHPYASNKIKSIMDELGKDCLIAVYDPHDHATTFSEIHQLSLLNIVGVFVQDIKDIGKKTLGKTTRPVTEIQSVEYDVLFIIAYDTAKLKKDILNLVPKGKKIVTLDEARIKEEYISYKSKYLDPLNFATNLAWFRDEKGEGNNHLHTRLTTANYWSRYGANNVTLCLILFDQSGSVIANWEQPLPTSPSSIIIDSAEVRNRFGLDDFNGQLFIHAVGIKGHDNLKYALDIYGASPESLSCTHDANSWPADFYAGLPAPNNDEKVILWIQNSHPCKIPPKTISINIMGRNSSKVFLNEEIPPYATYPLDTSKLLNDAKWPDQIEINAGKYFVRPRYEIIKQRKGLTSQRRVAHVNIERTDLKPDPMISKISNFMGKGFLLPAPVLPTDRYNSVILPTPMSTSQNKLPIKLYIYDQAGTEVGSHEFGEIKRSESVFVDVGPITRDSLKNQAGHMELVYDHKFSTEAVDGWLHALFRYEDKLTGHIAESSFGSHIFNTLLTLNGEPQSYSGTAPGLSTRLFLRIAPNMGLYEIDSGGDGADTFCHLIYPSSNPWNPFSETEIILISGDGEEIATRKIRIDCGGSNYWLLSEMFSKTERRKAFGSDDSTAGYVVVRDSTCRLFGYHGLITVNKSAFSLDHMFGF